MKAGERTMCWKCGMAVKITAKGVLPMHAKNSGGKCVASGRVPWKPK